MISDVKCGKYEGKGLPQEFGKRAVKGEFAARGKAQSIGTFDSPKKSGHFCQLHLTAQNLDLM